MIDKLSLVADQYPLSRDSSSFYDFDSLKREADEIRNSKNAREDLKKILMFEEKNINIFHILY